MSVHFITEPIFVEYDRPPLFSRRPHCPQRFRWRDDRYSIAALIQEWRQFTPRITPALRRLGLARIYFRVRLNDDRLVDIYFDPVYQRGSWFISKEILSPAPD